MSHQKTNIATNKKREFPYELQKYDESANHRIKTDFTGYLSGGLIVPPMNYFFPGLYVEYAAELYNFAHREEDVYVASYPKSGTTWSQEMVWLIKHDLDYEGAKTNLDIRFPFIESDFVIDRQVFLVNPDIRQKMKGSAPGKRDGLDLAMNLESPRCLKTHMPFSLLPPDLLDHSQVIYVARDPRDVLVSYYHHHKIIRSHGFQGDFRAFFNYFINEEVMWSPFWTHLEEANSRKDHPNLLIITYEQMKEDLSSVIHKVAQFLGKHIEEKEMPKLLDHLHVSSMKKNPAVNGQDDVDSGLIDGDFIRQGKTGGWKEYFDEEMKKIFNDWVQKKSKGLEGAFGWKF